MLAVVISFLNTARASIRSRAAPQLEILALRHQVQVLHRSRRRRVRLTQADRLLWTWLSRIWKEWRSAVVIVRPETVIAWHRRAFRFFWTWKSRRRLGRPTIPPAVRALIRTMSQSNPLWGAPRIHGELLKLGIDVSQATVAKYLVRHRRLPSQSWRTFLTNHVDQIMAADFFIVPTATGRLLFVLVMLAHYRRRVLHVAVTAHPTAAWTAQQLREAFPWDDAPRYLIRDRDLSFAAIGATAEAMAITEVLTAPLAVAKRVRRAVHRIRPTGVPRSRDHPHRHRLATHRGTVRGVLPTIADPFGARQRRAGLAGGLVVDYWENHRDSASQRSPSSVRADRRVVAPSSSLSVDLAVSDRSEWRQPICARDRVTAQ
jgi:putative transposase